MPNGRNRNLSTSLLVVPPQLRLAALQVSQSRFIKATENVLSKDFPAEFNGKIHNGVDVLVINELGDHPNDWFVVAANNGSGLLPFIYGLREAYYMTSYDGLTQDELGRANLIEWLIRGRNVAIYGHPYSMVKSKG